MTFLDTPSLQGHGQRPAQPASATVEGAEYVMPGRHQAHRVEQLIDTTPELDQASRYHAEPNRNLSKLR